jgi:hypothetical protein
LAMSRFGMIRNDGSWRLPSHWKHFPQRVDSLIARALSKSPKVRASPRQWNDLSSQSKFFTQWNHEASFLPYDFLYVFDYKQLRFGASRHEGRGIAAISCSARREACFISGREVTLLQWICALELCQVPESI